MVIKQEVTLSWGNSPLTCCRTTLMMQDAMTWVSCSFHVRLFQPILFDVKLFKGYWADTLLFCNPHTVGRVENRLHSRMNTIEEDENSPCWCNVQCLSFSSDFCSKNMRVRRLESHTHQASGFNALIRL